VTTRQRRPLPVTPAPVTLKFAQDSALQVQVLPPPKTPTPPRPWLRPLVGSLIFATVLYALLVILYVSPRTYTPPTSVSNPDVSLTLEYPTFLAFGDTGEIYVTVLNRGNVVITGTVVLEFSGTLPVRTVPSTSTIVELKDFKRGASQTARLTISLNRPIWLRAEDAQFQVFVEADGKRGALPETYLIRAAPIPYLGTSLAWLPTLSALFTGLLSLVWDVIKKRVIGAEAK